MIGATSEAVLQKSWQVVLEETLRGDQVQFFTYTEIAIIPGLDKKPRGNWRLVCMVLFGLYPSKIRQTQALEKDIFWCLPTAY